ncbi:MAG: BCCT family transporter [Lachnospirales bacterium]
MNSKKYNSVFIISVVVLCLIVVWGAFLPDSFQIAVDSGLAFITNWFTEYYILVMSSFVIFSFFLLFSKYGKIKLGEDDSKPEYSFLSWFAMLFSAGMGIGLVFWGVAEPIGHYLSPIAGVDPASAESMKFAFRKSFLHWGLHPWAGYVVIGGALAYMQYRKNKPGLISSLLIPIFGDKSVQGPLGKTVDIVAIFATVAGIVTSLGLGAYQINSGLNYLFGIPENNTVVFIIVVVATVMFVASSVSGLDKGVKLLSNINVSLAFLILVLTLIVGPTLLMFKNLFGGIFEYVIHLIPDMLPIGITDETKGWYGGWTVFYWAWWIAWAPFVGSFIARISKGRTIGEFVVGVLFAPLAASLIWFAVFGTAGINLGPEIAAEAAANTSTAVFVTMSHYKLGTLISGITTVLLCTFFVTSADSGTFVLGIFSSDGDLNPTASKKIIWGVIITMMALVLMFASDSGLQNVQTASIIVALPFSFIMIVAMIAWVKALLEEKTNNSTKTSKSEKISTVESVSEVAEEIKE